MMKRSRTAPVLTGRVGVRHETYVIFEAYLI